MRQARLRYETPRSPSPSSSRPRSRLRARSIFAWARLFVLSLVLSLVAATANADDTADAGAQDSGSDGGHDAASDTRTESARSRLDSAFQEDKEGHPVAALHRAHEALELSWTERDAEAARAARSAITLFTTHCAKVWFVIPKEARDLELTFDTRPVVDAKAGKGYYVEPGEHLVSARATVRGEPHAYDEKITIRAGENKLVEVVLSKAELVCPICENMPCFENAKTESDVESCLKARRGCGGCGAARARSPRVDVGELLLGALALSRMRRRRPRT